MKAFLFTIALAATAQAVDTVDAGGTRTSSANYTIDASLAPGTISNANNTTIKSGYIGQLFELTSLQFTATPATIDENASRQITVQIILDDTTTITPLPSNLIWSTPDLPITVDPTALATASIVYQDTLGTLSAAYLNLTADLALTVLDTNPDNFPPYASDGIDDDWQVLHFGENNPADAAPTADPDADTQNNLYEFLALVDPTDSTSFLDVRLHPDRATTDLIFTPAFPALRTYTVLAGTLPDPTTFTPLTIPTISDNGNQRTITDTTTGTARKFYRLKISKP